MSQNEANKDRQLALYQIGLTKIFPDVQHVKLVWHFLRQGIRREVVKNAVDLFFLSVSLKAFLKSDSKASANFFLMLE